MAEKAKEKETKAVAPWRPFTGLTRWEREMDRMMDEFFGRRMRPWWPERRLRGDTEEIIPAVDIYEEKDEIVVKAELPGMDKSDIEVNLSDSELTLKGEKKKEEKTEEENYFRSERFLWRLSSSVELPSPDYSWFFKNRNEKPCIDRYCFQSVSQMLNFMQAQQQDVPVWVIRRCKNANLEKHSSGSL